MTAARLRQLEIAVAVAGGRCAPRVHLPAAALTAQRRLATRLDPAGRALLARLDPAGRALLARLDRERDQAVRRAGAASHQ